MGLIIAGLVIYGPLIALVAADEPMFGFILGIPYAIYILGFIMIVSGVRKAGAIIVIIGSVAFIPLGILSIIGARKILDKIKEEEFQKKREAANAGQN